MAPFAPPPLPSSFEPAWRTYIRAGISLLPAFAAWIFGSIILQPRLELLWEKAGLVGSRPHWLMDGSNGIWFNFNVITLGLLLVLIALELRVRTWQSIRRPIIFATSVILNTVVIFWLLVMATCALLAAPILIQPK